MELKSWLEAESGRAVKLAKALMVYPSFISKIANGKKPVPFEQCMPIERATEGAVTRRDLRPNDYLVHWPELAHMDPTYPLPVLVPAGMALIPERRSGYGRRADDRQQPFDGPEKRLTGTGRGV